MKIQNISKHLSFIYQCTSPPYSSDHFQVVSVLPQTPRNKQQITPQRPPAGWVYTTKQEMINGGFRAATWRSSSMTFIPKRRGLSSGFREQLRHVILHLQKVATFQSVLRTSKKIQTQTNRGAKR